MRRRSAEGLDSILYFLTNALTSVIDDNCYLAHHSAAMPRIGAGLATAEIASRLAMFREQVCDASEREHMVVTKLARARHWAQELRRHEPHLRADIDAFLSATASCEAMARNRAPDAHSVFDGHAQPKRFIADRVPTGRVAAEAALSLVERLQAAERGEAPEEGPRYLIGGEISVDALNDACERLLARLSAHYGWGDEHSSEAGGDVPEDEARELETVDERGAEAEAVSEADQSDQKPGREAMPGKTVEAGEFDPSATGHTAEPSQETEAASPEVATEARECGEADEPDERQTAQRAEPGRRERDADAATTSDAQRAASG